MYAVRMLQQTVKILQAYITCEAIMCTFMDTRDSQTKINIFSTAQGSPNIPRTS